MRTAPLSALLILAFLSVDPGYAQNRSGAQLNITGAGARALGMGGAFIGVADDATAIVWNPAGLTQLERMEASAVGRFVFENTEYTNLTDSKKNNTQDQSHPVFNFGSFAIPFSMGKVKGVIAAAYQRQLDFYGQQRPDTTAQIDETGGADTFSPGVAVGISSIFSVGLSANIWFGHDVYKTTFLPSMSELTLDGKPTGVNFLAGILLDLDGLRKPIPVKIGACVRTPFDLNFDYSFSSKPANEFVSSLNGSTTQQMPLMIGIGASVRPWENLTLSVDYETRQYGDRKAYITVKSPTATSIDTSDISESKSDINQIRAGIEYLVVTRGGVFPLRAGYQNVPTLLANWSYTNQNPAGTPNDQVVGTGFSVGTGFISNSIALDLTYTRQKYERTGTHNGVTDESQNFTEQAVTASLIVYF